MEKVLIASSLFLEGPSFRYTVREVPVQMLVEYSKKHNVPMLNPEHVALAESYKKGEQLTSTHPYYASRGLDSVAYFNGLYRDIEAKGVVEVPVEVVVRKRQVIAFHGFHRFAFSYVLGLQTIPVSLITLDEDLIDLAINLFTIYDDPGRIALYQPIDHPYFELCPLHHPEASAKADAIIGALRQVDKTTLIIDFGAHLGYYSRRLKEAGYYNVVAVDCSDRMCSAQKQLISMGFMSLPYIYGAFEDYVKSVQMPCVLVALSVLHPHIDGGLANPLIAAIVPWIRDYVRYFVVEHLDVGDVEACSFWISHCGFTSERIIFHDDSRGRTTHLFVK